MGGPDEDRTLVGLHIVDPIRDGHPHGQRSEVMIVDQDGVQSPGDTRILEVSDLLLRCVPNGMIAVVSLHVPWHELV